MNKFKGNNQITAIQLLRIRMKYIHKKSLKFFNRYIDLEKIILPKKGIQSN